MGVTESHREPERDRERASKSQREPQGEPVRARGNQSELETTRKSYSEPELVKESSQAYLNIVLLQNNQIRLFFVATLQNTVFFLENC